MLLGQLAALDNVACKISGLVTEAFWATWRVQDLQPYVDRAIDVFGAGRLIFGSDWPVCLVAADYETVLGAARKLTAALSPSEWAAVFAGNAIATYRLSSLASDRSLNP